MRGQLQQIDLTTSRRIHIVGAGGSGMNAIAQVLLAMGHIVSGSDSAPSAALERLREAGAAVWPGHDPGAIPDNTEAVAVSTAIPADDPEVAEARRRGVTVLRRADVLSAIAATRRTVAVAGTHGKTTTSTLLALALEAGGVAPSWIIGGEIAGRGGGAHWDAGAWFVVEADESDGTFLTLGAEAALITNIEPDHLEHYGGWAELRGAFRDFAAAATGARVLCADDLHAREIAGEVDAVTYGHDESADYRIVDMGLARYSARFRIVHEGSTTDAIELQIAGSHNVTNATGALAMAHRLGVPLAAAAAGIESFSGVGRRFQRRGEKNGVSFVDDYAHLPGEVRAVLAGARAGKWDRVVAVFQPHRYSRTEQVGRDFGGAFDDADHLFLADVYAAGEAPRDGVDGTIVHRAVEATPGHPPITYVAQRSELAAAVRAELRPGDLCITLGAGDVTKLADEIQAFS